MGMTADYIEPRSKDFNKDFCGQCYIQRVRKINTMIGPQWEAVWQCSNIIAHNVYAGKMCVWHTIIGPASKYSD